jgi:hypothetical protein
MCVPDCGYLLHLIINNYSSRHSSSEKTVQANQMHAPVVLGEGRYVF